MPNILIHPNSGIIEFSTGIAGGSSFNPNFTGGANAVRLSYDNIGGLNITNYSTGLASGIDRFSVDGVNGRLFSVTDSLSGSLFSVNDIAGLPIIEAFDDNTVIMGAFNRNDFVLTGNSLGLGGFPNTGTTKLYVSGNIRADGNIFISGNPVLTGITDANWASQTELDSTGIALINRISSLSGSLNLSGTNLINWINSLSGSLNSSGISLTNTINSLSGNVVLLTGDQTISGNKTFVNSVEIIAPVSGMYGTGDLLNALNVRGFASIRADLSSLTGIFNPSGVGLSGVSPGQFSVGNMLIGADEGGAYIGRVGITENSWQILSGTEGLTWTARESDRSWFAIAMSSDGRIQTAVADTDKIYTSYDYGVTWIARESDRLWQSVAMSLDGKVQTAVVYDGQIYTSYDYGVTWIPKQNNRSWYDIAMSSDGRIQAGVVNDNKIYISYDYGVTWTARENNRAWISIEMSSDGRIQTAVTNGNKIYTSYDYGATWTARESNRNWYGIAMSSDGRIQTAAAYSNQIYTSYDYGVTWTARESNRNWFAIAMSSDGRIQTATTESNKIYTSYDYGETWTPREINRLWFGIAMSSDGRIQTAVANLNKIYTSYATTITPNPINVLGSVTANNLVYNTGNQIISGIKTFANDINASGTGTFGGLNLENINNLLLSGMNINITGNSIVNVFGNILISGNPVLTGVDLSSYATITNLASTGSTLQTNINNLSGYVNSSNSNIVFTTGNQTIDGLKIFTSGIDIYSGTSPQSIRIFDSTGTNSGEFGIFGWQDDRLIIGSQQSQSGILRNVTITGKDVDIIAGNGISVGESAGNINMLCGTGRIFAFQHLFGGVNMIAGPSMSLSSGTHNIYGNLNINNFGAFPASTIGPRTINIYRTGLGPPYFVPTSIVGISIDQNSANFQNGMALLVNGKEVYYQKDTIYFTGSSFTPDYASGRNFVYQLTGFATAYNNLNNPVNMPEGETIIIKVVQSNFANNYMIFGNNYRFPADASPLLTQASGKTDLFNILRLDNRFYTTYIKNFSN